MPAGSRTRRQRARPARDFPRAQYIVRRGEWEDATHPHERNRASYLADNFVPLAEAGVLQLVDDDQTIMPGVRVRRTGGHTMHHQIVLIESGGKTAAFVADLMPTTAHLPDAWIMGYDLYPMDTLAAKKAFVKEAVEQRDARVLRARSGGRRRLHHGSRTASAESCRADCQHGTGRRMTQHDRIRSASSAAAACTTWPN